MTATNHAMTGAIVGLTVASPVIALPLAFVSHYVLDAIPHFKANQPDEVLLKTNWFRNYLVVEALLCFLIVVALFVSRPNYWFIPAMCAFLAAAPDLFSINKYLKVRAGKQWKPGWYVKFAGGIQWFQRPIGAVVEVAWFIAALTVLANIL